MKRVTLIVVVIMGCLWAAQAQRSQAPRETVPADPVKVVLMRYASDNPQFFEGYIDKELCDAVTNEKIAPSEMHLLLRSRVMLRSQEGYGAGAIGKIYDELPDLKPYLLRAALTINAQGQTQLQSMLAQLQEEAAILNGDLPKEIEK